MDPGELALSLTAETPPPASLLVVDDEPLVAGMVRTVLEGLGHSVCLAANGRQGLDNYRRALDEDRPFSLVIIDLNMPVMDGRQCLREILGLDPQARVIMTSGYLDDELEEFSGQAAGLIRKPCSITCLVAEVNRVLGLP